MARSTCIKCGGLRFEMVENEPVGSNYKFMFVQCAKCGGVVGVLDFFNIGDLIQKLARGLRIDL
jgi:hypothetical protein